MPPFQGYSLMDASSKNAKFSFKHKLFMQSNPYSFHFPYNTLLSGKYVHLRFDIVSGCGSKQRRLDGHLGHDKFRFLKHLKIATVGNQYTLQLL